MSRSVIISVKPVYASKIISGEKTVELRRKFPADGVKNGTAFIYSSSPIKKIIGYTTIEEVINLPINDLWKQHGKQACVKKDFFYSYFDGLETGFALKLRQPIALLEPLKLRRMKEEFSVLPPQSFRYAPDKLLSYTTA